MQNNSLEEFMNKYDIIYIILVDVKSEVIYELGNKEKLVYDGIFKTYFYDMETVHGLNSLLEGQLMPKVFKQGKLTCCVCKPNTNTIMGIFYNETRDTIGSYKWTKLINEEVLKNFK